MEYNQDIDRQLDDYSACFDLYLEQGKLPPQYHDDPIADYMKEQMDFYRYFWGSLVDSSGCRVGVV